MELKNRSMQGRDVSSGMMGRRVSSGKKGMREERAAAHAQRPGGPADLIFFKSDHGVTVF